MKRAEFITWYLINQSPFRVRISAASGISRSLIVQMLSTSPCFPYLLRTALNKRTPAWAVAPFTMSQSPKHFVSIRNSQPQRLLAKLRSPLVDSVKGTNVKPFITPSKSGSLNYQNVWYSCLRSLCKPFNSISNTAIFCKVELFFVVLNNVYTHWKTND